MAKKTSNEAGGERRWAGKRAGEQRVNAIARERGPIDGVEAVNCCQRIDGRVGSDYLREHWYAVTLGRSESYNEQVELLDHYPNTTSNENEIPHR